LNDRHLNADLLYYKYLNERYHFASPITQRRIEAYSECSAEQGPPQKGGPHRPEIVGRQYDIF